MPSGVAVRNTIFHAVSVAHAPDNRWSTQGTAVGRGVQSGVQIERN